MSSPVVSYRFSKHIRKILVSISDALIEEPADVVIHDKHNRMIERCQILMFEMHPVLRFGFLLSLWFFDVLALFWQLGFRTFVRMNVEQRREFVAYWERTKNPLMREFFKAIRGFIMITYFSNRDIWTYIGYDPNRHVEDRIRLRKELLARGGESHENEKGMKHNDSQLS